MVNVTGAFMLGFVFTVLTERFRVASWFRTTLTIGLIGGYTTFSTLALETFRLMEDGALALSLAYGLGSLAGGLLAVYAGVVVGRVI